MRGRAALPTRHALLHSTTAHPLFQTTITTTTAFPFPCPAALANLWIQDVRDTLEKNVEALRELEGQARRDKLAELNVMRQVFNVCTSPVVQQAWDAGRQLSVHGLVYALGDGILKTIYSECCGGREAGPLREGHCLHARAGWVGQARSRCSGPESRELRQPPQTCPPHQSAPFCCCSHRSKGSAARQLPAQRQHALHLRLQLRHRLGARRKSRVSR